jgi:hypothetical protein
MLAANSGGTSLIFMKLKTKPRLFQVKALDGLPSPSLA